MFFGANGVEKVVNSTTYKRAHETAERPTVKYVICCCEWYAYQRKR